MVVFTCNHCGDSLQKPRVQKHYDTTCRRNPKSLTCVDCLKDFLLEDYAAHTKCVTETERYAAKGTVVDVPKGEKKQETWVEQVHNLIEEQKSSVSPDIKAVFELMLKHPNIPKKRTPFINYLTSSSGRKVNQKHIEAVWNILETNIIKKLNLEKQKTANMNGSNKNKEVTENGESSGKKKKNKKSKQNKVDSTESKDESMKTNDISTDSEKSKKRKSANIEAEVDVVPEANETSVESKKSKKKRKSTNIEADLPEINESTVSETRKKKRKSKKGEATEPEDVPEKQTEVEESNKKSKQKNNKIESEQSETNENAETSPKKQKKRKSQITTENGDTTLDESPEKKIKTDENGTENTTIKFVIEDVIQKILKKNPDGMLQDKLEGKVCEKFEKLKGKIEKRRTFLKKIKKKLKRLSNVSVENNFVKITV